LIRYYEQFRSFDVEIDSIREKIKILHGILETVKPVLDQLELDTSWTALQVRDSLLSCESGFRRLEKALQKCGGCVSSDSRIVRLSQVKNRFLYPLRRDTLRDLRETLEGLQANVDTALAVLKL
jgi:hypothetical protein